MKWAYGWLRAHRPTRLRRFVISNEVSLGKDMGSGVVYNLAYIVE